MTRVFVCYAHESPPHKHQVLTLAHYLMHHGVVVDLDQWAGPARQDWGAWATEHIESADFVILVASPDMRVAGGGYAASDQRRGVQNETAAIRDLLQRDRVRWLPRLLPVVLPGGSIDDIPLFMQPYSADHYVLADIADTDEGCEDLLRVLTAQPRYVAPPVGRVPYLPPRPAPVLFAATGPTWTRAATPVTVRWRPDLPCGHDVVHSTVEVHLVPVPAVRCQVHRLEQLAGELAALGWLADRSRGLAPGRPLSESSADAAWAVGGGSGLVVTRDGQRSGWFPLPAAAEFGSVLDRGHLVDEVAGLVTALAGIALTAPDAVAPAAALDPVGALHLGRVGDRPTALRGFPVNRVGAEPEDTVPFVDVLAHPADVAQELVARLVSGLR